LLFFCDIFLSHLYGIPIGAKKFSAKKKSGRQLIGKKIARTGDRFFKLVFKYQAIWLIFLMVNLGALSLVNGPTHGFNSYEGPKLTGTHQFHLFCTSIIFRSSTFSIFRPFLYFDRPTSNYSYWLRSTAGSAVLVEVKFGQKGRSKV